MADILYGEVPVMYVDIGDRNIPVDVLPKNTTLRDVVRLKENAQMHEDEDDSPFYVVDVGRIIDLYDQWMSVLPDVTPFYAVKANNDPVLLKVLAELGTGFDCASKNEMSDVLALGVSPERIIYANPCKVISHLKYAASRGVKKMTFDCEEELRKVKKYFPDAKLVLRVRSPNPQHQLGLKFGCSVDEGIQLLNVAKRLQLDIIGVSFHVGSDPDGNGCKDPTVHQAALRMSTALFDYALSIGYKLSLLDIGGSYPGLSGSENIFFYITKTIAECLVQFKAKFSTAEIISEPGRYFAGSTHALALMVNTKKTNPDGSKIYYVGDGTFGSFNVLKCFDLRPLPNFVKEVDSSCEQHQSLFWGPTCGPDKICTGLFPELEVGDWMYFKDMGAYTKSLFTWFNGFSSPNVYYYITDTHMIKAGNGIAPTKLPFPVQDESARRPPARDDDSL